MVEPPLQLLKEINSLRNAANALEIKVMRIYDQCPYRMIENLLLAKQHSLDSHNHDSSVTKPREVSSATDTMHFAPSMLSTDPVMPSSKDTSTRVEGYTANAEETPAMTIPTLSGTDTPDSGVRTEDMYGRIVSDGIAVEPEFMQLNDAEQVFANLDPSTPQHPSGEDIIGETVPLELDICEEISPTDSQFESHTPVMNFGGSPNDATATLDVDAPDTDTHFTGSELNGSLMDDTTPLVLDGCRVSNKSSEAGASTGVQAINYWDISDAKRSYRNRLGNPMARASRLPLRDYLGLSNREYLDARVSHLEANQALLSHHGEGALQ